jgi:DNA-binding XRE family transcriptional regulator
MHSFAFNEFATERATSPSLFLSAQHTHNRHNVKTHAPMRPAPAAVETAPTTLPRDISSRFGLRLREFRRSRNMTQLRMAVDFGIDRSFISDVERGRKSISLHMLEVIALGMKVSLSDLFEGI